ncbi:hypothetical protein SAMN06296020_103372 [Anoxynatronum buryatiense]|uniref:Uncharacterized protein n=1 Tax=Anoxynatronum buryatiense TaxID=489973 RepID=A0AA46AIG1_9CLOT|nr:hypothetical protein SAMN06296020_103372 [Anoxynatronum buryatiense]
MIAIDKHLAEFSKDIVTDAVNIVYVARRCLRCQQERVPLNLKELEAV